MKKSFNNKYKEILVIGDSHSRPDEPNDRFDWASRFILDRQPDIIVDIGDSADMPSLSLYDVGTVKSEGKRYVDDIESYKDAMRRLVLPIKKYNSTHTRWKKKGYNPILVKTRGNHESRITRAADRDPKLHGTLKIEDLCEEAFGFYVAPFLIPVCLEGIAFQHYFTSGVMARPIGGENHASSLVKKNFMSSVVGHSHERSFWETTDAIGRKRFGLVAGCYYEHEDHFTTESDRYWRGLVYLHDVHEGQAEPEFLSLENYIKPKYG